MLHTATPQQIREGLVTDIYFERTQKILTAKGIDREVRAEFIAKDSPQYARLFVVDVFQAVDRIADFPQSGRVVPELDDPIVREVILAPALRKSEPVLLTKAEPGYKAGFQFRLRPGWPGVSRGKINEAWDCAA